MAKQGKDKPTPPLRARWLGDRLKKLRDDGKLTLVDAADYLGKHSATISRFESGEYPIRSEDLLSLLDLYRVTDMGVRTDLLQHCEELSQRGWWDGYAPFVKRDFIDAIWLEQRATAIRTFELLTVPGLLQTEAYMETLIGGGPDHEDQLKVRRQIELRQSRQRVFEKPSPLRLDVILHESVLSHQVGGAEVMSAQLDRLTRLPKHYRVRLRVLPLSSWEPARLGALGPFRYFELVEPYPDVAQVETLGGTLYVELPEAEKFEAVYDQLWDACLDEAASLELITAVSKGLGDDGVRPG